MEILAPSLAALVVAILLVRGDWLNPATAFALPWLCMMTVGPFAISEYSAPMSLAVMVLIGSVVITAGASDLAARSLLASAAGDSRPDPRWSPLVVRCNLLVALLLLAAYAATIAKEGYVPLLLMLQGADPQYKDFGLPGIHGILLALQNAAALLAWVGYRTARSRWYLFTVAVAISLHVLAVSRQNLVLLVIELAICSALMNGGRISKLKLSMLGTVMLLVFTVIGQLRTGDIFEIAKVRDEYRNVPAPLIWLYLYSYLSTTVLGSAVAVIKQPAWSLNFLSTLIPSFLRPNTDSLSMLDVYMESSVTTYLTPLYMDVGFAGAVVYTFVMVGASCYAYHRYRRSGGTELALTYVVLLFCSLMSFFVDFWLYLPVIFQVPCLYLLRILSNSMSKPAGAGSVSRRTST